MRGYDYTRHNSYTNKYVSNANNIGRINKKWVHKVSDQFIASAIIALIVIVISNFNSLYTNNIIIGIKWVATENYDFKANYNNIKNNLMPDINNNLKNITKTSERFDTKDDEVKPTTNASIMIMPIDGKITSPFGKRKDPINKGIEDHSGIDIAGEEGAPIKSALGGIVLKIEENKNIGRAVTIKHNDGLETLYGHCSEILVDENQSIKQGDIIAKIGHTGIVTGPHLHFEVLRDGTPIDPISIIGSAIEYK